MIIKDAPLEACKAMCDKFVSCVSFEHNEDGDCALYPVDDFSLPCQPSTDRILYISTKDAIDPKRPRFLYQGLQNCFVEEPDSGAFIETQEVCEDLCSDEEECFGYQFSLPDEMNTTNCFVLAGSFPESTTCPGGNVTVAFLRSASNPYQAMDNSCLRNKLEFDSLIIDTEQYECRALCDAHAYCRYFLYGSNSAGSNPSLRECILFEAQANEIDDCAGYTGEYAGLKAFVNGRTFLDQISWFGEPETTVSYHALSAACRLYETSLTDSLYV
jgi:hypothetical protein